MYILYSLLLGIAVLLSLPWWLFQLLRAGKYRTGLRERLGRVPARLRLSSGCIWIHSVSVGEVLAVSQLLAELRQMSGRDVLVSTTTATGQQLAKQRFGEDKVFFLPLDFPFAVNRYMRALKPRLLVLAETEFWPNLLHSAKQSGAAVAVVNARVSDRSFPRYRRFSNFFSRVLANVDLFLAQSEEDARRLKVIGAPEKRVAVSGNLKFDIRLSGRSALSEALRSVIGNDVPVMVCGSTTDGEEELLADAFKQVLRQFPSVVMILAPRHPERFDAVAALLTSVGLEPVRRSTWSGPGDGRRLAGHVFLLDSVGELASIYGLCDIAFVGGSLVPVGGHNILEPAQHGVAVLTGPHTFNFRDIVRVFTHGGGLRVVEPEQVGEEFVRLLRNSEERQRLGRRARELFLQNTGATKKTVAALEPLLGGRGERE